VSDNPPKPRLCLRVGVTGHRPGTKLPQDSIPTVVTRVGEVLDAIKRTVAELARRHADVFEREPGTPVPPYDLVIVSSLAEGADRIVAEAGLSRGFMLDVVLPFPRQDYAEDFKAKPQKDQFFGLLDAARTVFELPGERLKEERAYEAAGLVMLANVDVLIAVWDGQEPAGIGGTALIVERAIAARVPVVLISPGVPDERPILLWTGEMELSPASVRIEDLERPEALKGLPEVLSLLLSPPPFAEKAGWFRRLLSFLAGRPKREQKDPLSRYLSERERRSHVLLGCIYPGFLQALCARWLTRTDFRLPPYLEGARADWSVYFEPEPAKTKTWPLDDRLSQQIDNRLLPAVAFADNLAVFYGSRYRGVYVAAFLLAALAVGLALSGVYVHAASGKFLWVILELVVIAAILILWFRGWYGDWHRRWLEYRRLGELLRHMRILSLIGAAGPSGRPSGRSEDHSYWVSWYAGALRRCLPVPNRAADPVFLAAVRARAVKAEIDGQIEYNKKNATRMKRMEHHIHYVGLGLFLATAALGLYFVYEYFVAGRDFKADGDKRILEHVTFFAALFPTVGAALNAIRVQGDFESVAHRSEQTIARLKTIKTALESEPLEFAPLSDRINKAVDAMSTDLDEWHVLFRTRPLSLPV
jgi:hypothetical protein